MGKLETKYQDLVAENEITFPGQTLAYVIAVPQQGRFKTITGFEFSFVAEGTEVALDDGGLSFWEQNQSLITIVAAAGGTLFLLIIMICCCIKCRKKQPV